MDNKKKIEIPFGAFDSELIHQEINIPNGFKAVINGNKIILTRVESEDDKIRKELIEFTKTRGGFKQEWIAWLENIPYTIDHEKREGFHLGYKAGLEKQGQTSDQIHYWTEEEIEPIISDYLRGAEHYGGMIGRLRCLKPKSLEKQRTSYTKSDVDDAYLKGLSDAKNELEKQGEQKPTDKDMIEALRTEYEKGRADVIADTLSWLDNCWPKYCSNQTIIDGYKEAIKGE